MSDRLDTLIDCLKWPAAIAAVILLLPAGIACVDLIKACIRDPGPMLPFIGGAGFYLLAWLYLFRRWRATLLSTFEHEMTHALFAVLTLHRVVELRATWSRGGHVKILGRGNWLITVSPYFFPTVCFVLFPVIVLVPGIPQNIGDALLGAAFMYHITSTMRETHAAQSDLKTVGYPFSVMLLPTANLLSSGVVLAVAYGGWSGVAEFFTHVGQVTSKLGSWVGF